MTGENSNMTSSATRILCTNMRAWASGLRDDRRGAVAMIYALVFIAVLSALGVGVDLSNTLQIKYRLDLAADAAAIACGEAWQTDMTSGFAAANTPTLFTTLYTNSNANAQYLGKNAFFAQAAQVGTPIPRSAVNVTANYAVASNGGPQVTCAVTYTASNTTYIMRIVGFSTLTISGNAQSIVSLSPYTNVYFILDTSASMMVGSTSADNLLIATWMASHYNDSITDNGSSTKLSSLSQQPCSFSCHENSTAQSSYGVNLGVTNAHSAGAKTRFDILLSALTNDPLYSTSPSTAYSSSYDSTLGEGLLPYIRDTYLATNARANLNTFSYNVFGFNQGINHSNPTTVTGDYSQNSTTNQTSLQQVAAVIAGSTTLGVTGLNLGFSTHFNPGKPTDSAVAAAASCTTNSSPYLYDASNPANPEYGMVQGCFVGPQLVKLVGSVAASPTPGSTSSNPEKFVILVTDGVNSDVTWTTGAPPQLGIAYTSQSYSSQCALWNISPYNECSADTPSFGKIPGTTTSAWNGFNTTGFIGPFNTAYCTALKNNGVTVAVLETPYVPLYGQDPGGAPYVYPYEAIAQYPLFPTGPTSTNAASTALSNCASTGYYYQATSNAGVTSGFITLFNKFVGQWVHVTK